MKWLRELVGRFTRTPTAWVHPDGTISASGVTFAEPRLVEYAEGGYLFLQGRAHKLRKLPVDGWATEERST